ncbi:YggS family pyridoxal phosphate-dependent enzyme [Streptococcus sp. DD12]|uniref:YggS family pyridoxal phosphate-dependent enzyme n=1 Tax=Streptococcus sp. DD12 TaxID=1777880 RepID=UPI0007924C4C|nr:YggS family pyridoxal phosphate-dependent enzyme [Streptococcus sp. DD12]KXT75756.1 hypothetical protein STRDD12_00868 [Streptococcus sp. DD12]
MTVAENTQAIEARVAQACQKAGRDRSEVHLVAVTKYVTPEKAQEVVDAGVTELAENRVDKFLEKYQALAGNQITWHLIGSLQRRKVKDVINKVDYFHALDSVKLAQEIDKRADHPVACFLQVNVSGEESKHGFAPEDIDAALDVIGTLDKVRIIGLMTMAPIDADHDALEKLFEETNQLRASLAKQNREGMTFSELSMGMSRDFPEAIAHGATFVRVGTAFFE